MPDTSAQLYRRGLEVMPGGCSRNTVLRKPHPVYAERGEGCYVTDVEGVRRMDCANNMASLIHGHSHPAIVAAVTEQLQRGTAFSLATEVEVRFAEHLTRRNPGFEKIRFVNSGTEAVMCCLKAARAFTGRPRIAKAEGAYHGSYDFAEVSQTARPANWGDASRPASVPVARGTPESVLGDVVVIPYNDTERALQILDAHKAELACILIDLMPHRIGLKPANPEFVQAMDKWARDNGSLLVCDEVITLRSSYGGAQQKYSITPDLTAMGKMIGGGFPVGALAGRADIMDVMDPWAKNVLFPHSGTFSANPVTMVAGLTAMELFDRDAVERLNSLAHYARGRITEVIALAGVPACVTGKGSMFRVHMKEDVPDCYRAAFPDAAELARLGDMLNYLFDHGVIMINTCSAALSTAMKKSDIDMLADTMLAGFRELQPRWSGAA